MIRTVQPADWPSIAAIYQQGIDTGDATMETQAPPPDKMAASYMDFPKLVAEEAGEVVGYALLTAVSERCVYAGVAEVSLYVSASNWGQGIGRQLLNQLIIDSEQQGIWTLQAGIFPENKASVAVHKQCGFREVGYRERIGQRNGQWRNVLLLERRSTLTGIN